MNPAIAEACAAPRAVADRLRAAGQRIVWTLGADIPPALIDACGHAPIRLVPDDSPAERIGALIGAETLSARGRALLAAIDALDPRDTLLISHADAEQPQIFATLRELARVGAIKAPRVHFLDLLTIDRPATRAYNRARIDQAIAFLGGCDDDALSAAIAARNAQAEQLAGLLSQRRALGLSGGDVHRLLAASAILPPGELAAALAALPAAGLLDGVPVLLSGSTIENPALVDRIEAAGAVVVGEDHGWGEDRALRRLAPGDPRDALAGWTLAPTAGPFSSAAERAGRLGARLAATGAARVVHLELAGDESAPWEAKAIREGAGDVPGLRLSSPDDQALLGTFLATGQTARSSAETAGNEGRRPPPPKPPRSRKSLAVLARFSAYQREWFAAIRAQAAAGATFAAVNANTPQEILRALDIPFVVNQWWASIVAAKQQSGRYAALLDAAGLPPATEAYSAQGVAAALDTDGELAPWGGLPKPDVLGAVLTTDATPRLFETWAELTGAALQRYERSIEGRWDIPVDWWDGLAEDWESYIEPERLDLFEAELRAAVAQLEALTGRRFDEARFRTILDLVNEQQDYYRKARDLVARTVPAPVSVVDTMPATMVPQWHRGTEWARDAARDFYLEVKARADAGEGACPNERLRLMFVGRGIWSDMSFYQRWEESHGAVFVCSMYLSLAADGYIRRHDGRDPMRALAARFVTMGDELRMPTWAGAWHVKEATLHGCHGAMALSDADPLVIRSLREAGIPVLELGIDNFARDPRAEAEMERRAADFLDGLLAGRRV